MMAGPRQVIAVEYLEKDESEAEGLVYLALAYKSR